MAVTFNCADLDKALLSEEPESISMLVAHAASCPRCGDELAKWNALSEAADSLRKDWASPQLWLGIRRQLAAEFEASRSGFSIREVFSSFRTHWQVATAALVMGAISLSLVWVLVQRSESTSETIRQISERRLLTEKAVRDVEGSEAVYLRSIDRLSKLVNPKIRNPRNPLLTSYHEKLKLLDAAIADCRTHVDQNRFNAHLRRELLVLYQEKQRTLKELTNEEQ